MDCSTQAVSLFPDMNGVQSSVQEYEAVYIKCPSHCYKEAKVMGRTIYNPETPVCAAGIMDGSIPYSGGLLGVFVQPG